MAFTTTWDLGIPTLIVHYESYTNNFNKTKADLLQFLEQDEVNDAPTFITGKRYKDHYTQSITLTLCSKLRLSSQCAHIRLYDPHSQHHAYDTAQHFEDQETSLMRRALSVTQFVSGGMLEN